MKAVVPTAAGPIRVEATSDRLVFDSPVRAEVVFAGIRRAFPAGRHELRVMP